MSQAQIHELLIGETAAAKLGARGIDPHEAQQLLENAHKLVRNHGRRRTRRERSERRLLIGRTDGGTALTLVVEMTGETTTWVAVTGWVATQTERRMIGDRT